MHMEEIARNPGPCQTVHQAPAGVGKAPRQAHASQCPDYGFAACTRLPGAIWRHTAMSQPAEYALR